MTILWLIACPPVQALSGQDIAGIVLCIGAVLVALTATIGVAWYYLVEVRQ